MINVAPDSKPDLPRVCVVVLNWNGLHDTIECLNSLKNSTYAPCDIFVVDNGSTDGSVDLIPKQFPSVQFIPTGENLGWAGGNNVGIKLALAEEYDYIFLLNNDTVVNADCIALLTNAAEKLGPALLHPAIYYFDEPSVPQLDPSFDKQEICNTIPIQLDHAYGAALFIHASVFETVGMIDERFFLQLEETDFFLRSKDLGIGSYCLPVARLLHKESRSFGGRVTPMKSYYIIRNSLLIAKKHSKSIKELTNRLKRVLWTVNRMISDARKSNNEWRASNIVWLTKNQPEAKAIRAGIFDFFCNKFGKSKNDFNQV